MHQPIRDGLEAYLRSGENHEFLLAFRAHLNACEECRATVERMKLQSEMLRALRAPEVELAPGFYARVMSRVEAQRHTPPSFWSLLLDARFGRRLMFATATLLVLLGTFLVSSEPGDDGSMAAQSAPEAIMAPASDQQPPALSDDQQRDRDAILVTLTTYQE